MKRKLIKLIRLLIGFVIVIFSIIYIHDLYMRSIIKEEAINYLNNKYDEDMEITSIGYNFKDGSYYLTACSYNDVTFRLDYHKRFGIIESHPYFISLWGKEIANDISSKSSEICDTYIGCLARTYLDNYETDLEEYANNIYKQTGCPPSITKLDDKSPEFIVYISIPKTDMAEEDDKLYEICDYAFSKYNINSIYIYKGTFRGNIYKELTFEDFKKGKSAF